jgi:hypothetical protein
MEGQNLPFRLMMRNMMSKDNQLETWKGWGSYSINLHVKLLS